MPRRTSTSLRNEHAFVLFRCPKSVLTVGDNGGPRTIVNVSIVDLDPKCLSNLAERVEAEQRVVEQFLKHYQTLRLRQDDEVNENVGP